jgi:hypothetical protein
MPKFFTFINADGDQCSINVDTITRIVFHTDEYGVSARLNTMEGTIMTLVGNDAERLHNLIRRLEA